MPREELTGIRTDAKRDLRACWGDIVEVYKTPKIMNSMEERSVTCIALAPSGNSTGSWFFLSLHSGSVVKGYRWSDRNLDELALKTILEMNRRNKTGKSTEKAAKIDPADQIQEPADQISQTEEKLNENEEIMENKFGNTSAINSPKPQTRQPQIPRETQQANNIFENSESLVNENQKNEQLLRASQSELQIKEEGEDEFLLEQVCSYLSSKNPFPEPAPTSVDCYNLKVGDAIKKFPDLAVDAIKAEIQQMVSRGVFEPIKYSKIPQNQKCSKIFSSMFLKEKLNPDGSLKKLKARLVAGGHMQDRNLYEESSISSPTVSVPAVLMVAALGADQGSTVFTIDFPGAYLNSNLTDSFIYMTLDSHVSQIYADLYPEARAFMSEGGRITVRLLKALYGLLESGRLWYENIRQALIEYGFIQNRKDPCVFVLFRTPHCLIVCLYVDDLLIVASIISIAEDFISFLRSKYDDLTINKGNTHNYLGMNMHFTGSSVEVTMDTHVNDVVSTYSTLFGREMPSRAPSSPATADLFNIPDGSELLGGGECEAFHTVVAKLLFVAKRVRPDLLAPVSFLSGRVREPTESDRAKLERLVAYVHHTRPAGIKLDVRGGRRPVVTAWVDSSFGSRENGAGQTGYVLSLGGGPILASSSKQRHVTSSSGECELAGLYDGSTAVIWARDFLIELGYKVGPALILHDNTSSIALAKKGHSSSKRSRHYHIKHFFIADRIKDGEIELEYCEGKRMKADILTKGVSGRVFNEMAREILNI